MIPNTQELKKSPSFFFRIWSIQLKFGWHFLWSENNPRKKVAKDLLSPYQNQASVQQPGTLYRIHDLHDHNGPIALIKSQTSAFRLFSFSNSATIQIWYYCLASNWIKSLNIDMNCVHTIWNDFTLPDTTYLKYKSLMNSIRNCTSALKSRMLNTKH